MDDRKYYFFIKTNKIKLLLWTCITLILFITSFSCQSDKEEYFEICIKKIYVSCGDTLCIQSHVELDLISHYKQDTIDILMSTFFKRRGIKFFTLFDEDTVNISFAGDIFDFPPKWKEENIPYMQYRLIDFDYRQTENIELSDSILTRQNVTKIINSPINYYVEGKGYPKYNNPVELRITRSDTLKVIFQDETKYKYGNAYPM
jgi:hypothetical protein